MSTTHTVTAGDTLWHIAEDHYDDGNRWPAIYQANEELIRRDAVTAGLFDPASPGHWIFPGQVLTIPKL